MKKNKLLVILSLALTLSCLLSALSMNAFAGILDNDYYVTNREVTPISGVYGYSSASFTGNFYTQGDARNNAILATEAYGGPWTQIDTELSSFLDGAAEVMLFSSELGEGRLSATQVSYTIAQGDMGGSYQSGVGNSSVTGEDSWYRYYYADWDNFPSGWINYSQHPET